MKMLRALLMVAVVMATSILCCTADEKSAPIMAAVKQADTTVKGKVVDEKGKPITKAKVFLLGYKPGSRKLSVHSLVYTDAQGRFTCIVEHDKTLRGSLMAVAAGYTCAVSEVPSGNEAVIALSPEYRLKGIVVDDNGKPLAGVKVEVERFYAYRSNHSGLIREISNTAGILEAISGKDGRYVISHLMNPKDYDRYHVSLNASKTGRASIMKSFNNETIDAGADLTVPKACVVEGTLYMPDKTGFAPEGTKLAAKIPQQWGWQPHESKVDKQGRFKFDALPPGKVTVLLGRQDPKFDDKGNYIPSELLQCTLPAVVDKELTPGKAENLDLVLTPGALIKGTITSKDTGKPINQAVLMIEHAGAPHGTYWSSLNTDESGQFSTRVAAGDVRVIVQQFESSYFQHEDAPSIEFTVSDGQEKTDVALAVSPSENDYAIYEAVNKPIPADFELIAGNYELTWDPELTSDDSAYSSPNLSGDKVQSKLKDAPKWISKNVKQIALNFDGKGDEGLLVVALDESKGTGKGYDTFYVDLNRNWNLADDEPIKARTRNGSDRTSADWVTVVSRQFAQDGQKTDYPIQVKLEGFFSGSYIYVRTQRKGGWKGTLESSKGKVECAVTDTNFNGIYGDPWTWKENGESGHYGDQIYIDTNGSGKVATRGSHAVNLNPAAKVGTGFYSIKVSGTGNKINVEPYSGATGYLVVKGENIQGAKAYAEYFYVTGSQGSYDFSAIAGKPVLLPAATYRVQSCNLVIESEGSKKLPLSCALDSPVEVKAGETATVDITGKLSLAFNPQEKDLRWEPGRSASISWMIKIGDKVTLNSIGDRRPDSTPSIKFFDKKGKLLHTVKAGYT